MSARLFQDANMAENDLQPITNLNRQRDKGVNFSRCLFCQENKKKDELRRATDDGRKRVQNAMNERERLGDRGSIMITDQLKKLSAEDWETKTLMWRRNCYTNFASVSRLERLRNKATKDRNKLSPYPKRRKPG